MVETKQDILGILERSRSRLQALGVRRIGLFGSFVRGEQRPGSDVDLLVEFDLAKKTFDAFVELSFFLEEALGRRTPRRALRAREACPMGQALAQTAGVKRRSHCGENLPK